MTLLTAFFLVAMGPEPRDRHVAPFYAIPAQGVWVEYECKSFDAKGAETAMTLRLAHAGQTMHDGRPCAWIEIKLTTHVGKESAWKLRKLLIDMNRYRKTADLKQCVVEVLHQAGPEAAMKRLPVESWSTFLSLGLPTELALRDSKVEEVTTPLGRFSTRRSEAISRIAGEVCEYRVWLSVETPFGFAQFQVTQTDADGVPQSRFQAVAKRVGKSYSPE